MVAGHLQEKGGQLYAVLSYKDRNGKRCTKWITTGLPVKGNKKKAEAKNLCRQKLEKQKISLLAMASLSCSIWTSGLILSRLPSNRRHIPRIIR